MRGWVQAAALRHAQPSFLISCRTMRAPRNTRWRSTRRRMRHRSCCVRWRRRRSSSVAAGSRRRPGARRRTSSWTPRRTRPLRTTRRLTTTWCAFSQECKYNGSSLQLNLLQCAVSMLQCITVCAHALHCVHSVAGLSVRRISGGHSLRMPFACGTAVVPAGIRGTPVCTLAFTLACGSQPFPS